MKTSIYIMNNSIQVVRGKPRKGGLTVKEWISAPLPPESVVNGVIVNDQGVRDTLRQMALKLGRSMNKVDLVLSSSSLSVKIIEAPVLPKKMLLKFVEGKFSDLQNRGEMIYDYSVLRPSLPGVNRGLILATAVERDMLKAYVSIFQDSGIKVSHIGISMAAVERFSSTSLLRGRTCVLALLDGNSMETSLFVEGNLRMFNHVRLFQERGTTASASEILRTVSSIMQFNASEKNGHDVEAVLFGGLKLSEQRVASPGNNGQPLSGSSLCERISAALEVAVGEIPACREISAASRRKSFPLAKFFCCAGNILGR